MTEGSSVSAERQQDGPNEAGDAGQPPDTRRQSRRSLDALSFFVADAQTGFGPYIASYLSAQGWNNTDIGNALGIGTVAAALSQLPGGALVDRLRDKRLGAAIAWSALALSAILFAVAPTRTMIYFAEILHSFATSMLAPAIAAISLALVGRKSLAERLGRNARYAAIGNGGTAALLGAAGAWISARSVFWLTAAFVVPGVILLFRLPHPRKGPGHPDPRDSQQKPADRGAWLRETGALFTHKGVLGFAVCVALFHLSNAAVFPLAGTILARMTGNKATLYISACTLGAQIIVAVLSPWIGRNEERNGVRWILMAGYAAVPLRAALLGLATMLDGWTPDAIVVIQLLDGISATVFGVSLPIMAADLTKGSNHFNLCLGFFGIAITIGATLGNSIAGRAADAFGFPVAFAILAVFGVAAVASVYITVPDGAGQTKGGHIKRMLTPRRFRSKRP